MSVEWRCDEVRSASADAWAREYAKRGIPSSVREQPSAPVVDLVARADGALALPSTVLDIGCGLGRNALFLAAQGFNVVAMDFTAGCIADLKRKATRLGLSESIMACRHDVRRSWPVEDHSAQAAIDTFCFKHQIDAEAIDGYVANASAKLCEGAPLIISFAGRGDGYYRQFPVADQRGPGVIIVDPGNQIASRLYDPEELIGLFAGFEPVHVQRSVAVNEMHGAQFERETFVVQLRRRARS